MTSAGMKKSSISLIIDVEVRTSEAKNDQVRRLRQVVDVEKLYRAKVLVEGVVINAEKETAIFNICQLIPLSGIL